MAQQYPDFLSKDRPQTLIAYGIVTNPETIARSFERSEGQRPFELTNRYALVSPASPGLRLSSPGWIDISVQQMSQVRCSDDLFDLCRERLINRSSPFSKLIRLFVERYLEFARAQLERHKSELGAGTADDEIFNYRDWIFSAWLPLPQAQILLPAAFAADRPSFAELDIAFSLPGQLIGVMIESATIYVTASPCWNCFKTIANAGIARICYGEFYRDDRIFEVAEKLGIELVHLPQGQDQDQAPGT